MKLILTICLCFGSLFSIAQFKESFYALDKQWKQTDEKSAKYLLWIHLDSAGNWEYSYYHMWGPMIKLQTYKDHDGTTLNGLSCYYYTSGNLDSIGHYKDGKKDGKFIKYAFLPHDTLRAAMLYDYVRDSLIKVTDPGRDTLGKPNYKDSSDVKESIFPGGIIQWQQYLQHHLQYPDRAMSREIQGIVRMIFQIDEDGNVVEPIVSKSVEYSLDREAFRIIVNSGKWEPASVNGRKVVSYKTQPLVFKLEVSK
ncbi:MAG: TonB family protein [Bacteroidota bacterium]|nr:TonB family protein [Bacteroidota bacterium]MDP4211721.1 TonB family protein [Bacteroidota bacterium]MDP4250407.1 TonB family protein [Bacteroidota bacterium]